MTKSLGDYLDMWFEGKTLKDVMGLEGVIGNFAEPYQAGTAYVLLYHAFGEVNGRIGAWGIARGGMGAITQAMASFARTKGVAIETNVSVKEVIVKAGKTQGVVTDDGRKITSRVIAGNIHPQILLMKMLDPALLSADEKRRIKNYRNHSATFRMNVALSELPISDSLPECNETVLSSAIEICPSLAYISDAYNDARTRGWASNPVISMWIPTTQDDTRCANELSCRQFILPAFQ